MWFLYHCVCKKNEKLNNQILYPKYITDFSNHSQECHQNLEEAIMGEVSRILSKTWWFWIIEDIDEEEVSAEEVAELDPKEELDLLIGEEEEFLGLKVELGTRSGGG